MNIGFLPEESNARNAELNEETNRNTSGRESRPADAATDLPNSVTSSSQSSSEKDETVKFTDEDKSDLKDAVAESSESEKQIKIDIEKEIDALSVPTVFSSSPVITARSSRHGNIKMLKVIPL